MTPLRWRAAAAAALVAAAVTACGGEGSGGALSAGSATTATPAAGADPTTSGTAGPDTGGTVTTTGPVGSPGGAGPPPDPAAPAVLDADVPTGHFAPALLRPDLSERVVIEIQAQPGAEPRAATLDHLTAVLGDVSGKPVEVRVGAPPPGGARQWSPADLRTTADAGAVTAQGGGVAVIRLLFVHGSSSDGDHVLGMAVRGDVAAVFVDRVEAATTLVLSAAPIELAVATHELGHLLGLVDLLLPTGRADPAHPGHSTNPESVMYFAVESDLIGQLIGGPPRHFDAADRADLDAIRQGRG